MKISSGIICSVIASIAADKATICEQAFTGVAVRTIGCPGGRIHIKSADYGREEGDISTCCKNKKFCRANDQCTTSAADWLSQKCEGESECTIYGGMNKILGDPCRRNHKYLSIDYECDYSSPNLVQSFCEVPLPDRNEVVSCSGDKVLRVVSASWGRGKDSFCCPQGRENSCRSETCSSTFDALSVMRNKCDNKNSCEWNNDIKDDLKDPCLGTYKYMSLSYRCENEIERMSLKTSNNCGDVTRSLLSVYQSVFEEIIGDTREHNNKKIYTGYHGFRKNNFPKRFEKVAAKFDGSSDCVCKGGLIDSLSKVGDAFERLAKAEGAIARAFVDDSCEYMEAAKGILNTKNGKAVHMIYKKEDENRKSHHSSL